MNKNIIVIDESSNLLEKIKIYVPNEYNVKFVSSMKKLFIECRKNTIDYVFLYMDGTPLEEIVFMQFRKSFPYIFVVAIFSILDIELARKCGAMGIERVYYEEKLSPIKDLFTLDIAKKNNVILDDILIDKKNADYSTLLKRTLYLLEDQYLSLFYIQEVADLLEISLSALSREFSKYRLPGPKRILMSLKIQHSLKLLQNPGLNIKEIALLSGFINEKNMNQAYKKMLGISPGRYRESLNLL